MILGCATTDISAGLVQLELMGGWSFGDVLDFFNNSNITSWNAHPSLHEMFLFLMFLFTISSTHSLLLFSRPFSLIFLSIYA